MPAKSAGLTKPKKVLPPKALTGKDGHWRGSDNTPLRAYDPNQATSTIVPRTNGATTTPQPVTSSGGPGTVLSGGGGSGSSGQGSNTGGAMPGGYTPAGYNDVFWEHPDALAQDFLSGIGIASPQMTEQFAPVADALNLLTSFLGADAAGELLDPAGQANQNIDYMTQLMTPGGQALDPSAILMAMANADPNSAAGLAMGEMTPEKIQGLAMQLVSAAGGNPFQAMGLQAGLDQGTRDFNVDRAKGAQGVASRPYWENLQTGPLGGFFGG